jgi:hypothetical protein
MPTLKGISQSDEYLVTYWSEECKKKVRYLEKSIYRQMREEHQRILTCTIYF